VFAVNKEKEKSRKQRNRNMKKVIYKVVKKGVGVRGARGPCCYIITTYAPQRKKYL